MHVDGEWSVSPPDPDTPSTRSAPATLMYLSTDHKFSMLQCWVIDSGGKMLAISPGDPHRIFIGRWSGDDDAITVKYRLVYELVQPVGGGKYPGSEETGAIKLRGKVLDFKRVEYSAANVSLQQYEDFIRPERSKLKATW
ncbi:MAG: hypothetical protein M3Q69_06100 [Acidobacteriota bacterium]|nr:hypothetical protein [Acidobacteriota bacterium]